MPTREHYLSQLHFFINSRRQPYNDFGKLILPFVIELWIILLIILLCGTVGIFILSTKMPSVRNFIVGAKNRYPIYNMIVLGLGGNISISPARNFARFVFINWLLATLVLRSAYQAFMFHFMRMDINLSPPNTIKELLAQNYQFVMSDDIYFLVKNFPEIATHARLLNGSEWENFKLIENTYDKMAMLSPLGDFRYYKSFQKTQPKIHVVSERIFTQAISIYMRRNSILLHPFNRVIQEYMYLGFNQIVLGTAKKTFSKKGNIFEKMKLKEIFGALQILVVGYILSVLVFGIEILIYKLRK